MAAAKFGPWHLTSIFVKSSLSSTVSWLGCLLNIFFPQQFKQSYLAGGITVILRSKGLLTCMCLVTDFLLESQYTGQVDNSSSRGAGSSHVLSGVNFLHFYVCIFPWSLSAIPKQKELCSILLSLWQNTPTDGMLSSHAVH